MLVLTYQTRQLGSGLIHYSRPADERLELPWPLLWPSFVATFFLAPFTVAALATSTVAVALASNFYGYYVVLCCG